MALSPVTATARRLSIVWGLHCIVGEEPKDVDGMVERACRVARSDGFAEPGERIIITAGLPLGTPGATNMLRISVVGDDGATPG
jgi:pyruvate kinase